MDQIIRIGMDTSKRFFQLHGVDGEGRPVLRRQLTLVASWTFSNIIQADCARFSVERGIDVDRLFTHRWTLDQAEERLEGQLWA